MLLVRHRVWYKNVELYISKGDFCNRDWVIYKDIIMDTGDRIDDKK